MKILALHGYGTSGAILESLLGPLRSRLDETWEFVFLDGEVKCQKAQGLGNFVEGPFLCYNRSFAPADIESACELVDSTVAEEGPFDGILGMSQGGSIAMTYLFRHYIEQPQSPPPFRFAVFMSSVVAFAYDTSYGEEILRAINPAEKKLLSSFPNFEFKEIANSKKRVFYEYLADVFRTAKNGGFIDPDTEVADFENTSSYDRIPRVMHPLLMKERIKIPTVHITGQRDDPDMVRLSNLLKDLCDPRMTKAISHTGGHDAPRSAKDIEATILALEWAVDQSSRSLL